LSYTRADADGSFLLGCASAKGNRRRARRTRLQRATVKEKPRAQGPGSIVSIVLKASIRS